MRGIVDEHQLDLIRTGRGEGAEEVAPDAWRALSWSSVRANFEVRSDSAAACRPGHLADQVGPRLIIFSGEDRFNQQHRIVKNKN